MQFALLRDQSHEYAQDNGEEHEFSVKARIESRTAIEIPQIMPKSLHSIHEIGLVDMSGNNPRW